MEIKELKDNEYINNKTVISHVPEVLDFGMGSYYETKELETKIITDGEIDDKNEFSIE